MFWLSFSINMIAKALLERVEADRDAAEHREHVLKD
jgi:hypothetical protein